MVQEIWLYVLDDHNKDWYEHGTSNFNVFKLNVDKVNLDIMRQPIIIPVPTGTGTPPNIFSSTPQAYGLDYGMMTETITMNGKCQDNEPDTGVASIGQLQQIARQGWFGAQAGVATTNTDKLAIVGGVMVRINMGYGQGREINDSGINPAKDIHYYQGLIVNFRPSREGGNMWWDWSLQIQVAAWPQNPQMRFPSVA